MKDGMEYKGYIGTVHFSSEDEIFYGKVKYIKSLISFEGHDVESLKSAFQEAVEDYLDLCEAENLKPEKPFKGTFNVRIGSERHRRAVLFAEEHELNLNTVIAQALEQFLPPP
jgi:predicted HicB family RNase H-like nuclease